MSTLTEAPPHRVNGRGHDPRSNPLSIEQITCRCGCGEVVTTPGRRVVYGHRKNLVAPLCKCGCGRAVNWRGGGRGWALHASGCFERRRIPSHPPWTDTDPAFWDWFAGFADGEGCFGVVASRSSTGTWPQPYFKIAVRADERPILEEIAERMGCGRVNVHVPGSKTSNLQLKFELTSLSDCERLIEILSAHPLRAKKARDFETWAEIVREKAVHGVTQRVWDLRDQLMAERAYDAQRAGEVA
jgi:hypothetical protein